MENLKMKKNEKLLAISGLADEKFLELAEKYKTYSNYLELWNYDDINRTMKILKSFEIPLSITLNERNVNKR